MSYQDYEQKHQAMAAQAAIDNEAEWVKNLEAHEREHQGLYSRFNFDIAKFASKEESRYTLQGILVTPSETVATDGHRLIRVSTVNDSVTLAQYPTVPGVPSLGAGRFLLSNGAAAAIAKAMPKKQTIPVLNYAAPIKPQEPDEGKRQVGFVTTDLERVTPITEREMIGTFPNYEAVMPKDDDEVLCRFAVSATYLAELASYFAKLDGRGSARDAITFTLYKSQEYNVDTKKEEPISDIRKALKIEGANADNGQKATALLMPMRA